MPETINRKIYYIPIVNIFYDFLFDETPTMDQIVQIILTFAFLNGLILGVVANSLSAIAPEDAHMLRERSNMWTANDKIKLLPGEVIDPYERFVLYADVAFDTIVAAVMILVLISLFSSATTFRDKNGCHSNRAMSAWWLWNKWLIALIFVLTACGLTMMVISIKYLFSLCHATDEDQLADFILWTDVGNYFFLLLLGFFVPVFILSAGVINREMVHSRAVGGDESVEEHVRRVIAGFDVAPEAAEKWIKVLVKDNYLTQIKDLRRLEGGDWKRMKLPLKLELALKDEIDEIGDAHSKVLDKKKTSIQSVGESE